MTTPVGPYTPVVRSGEWIICSGQVGLGDGGLVEGGVRAELRQAMTNLASLLGSQGASLADVVKTTVFLVDMHDYGTMNEVYVEAFEAVAPGHRPARSAVAVAALPIGAQVEIEAWARVPGA
ncbi:MAG TPA: RidA family protein [Acidimicrobiales bacterium]|nr:RidA family protein [Acidimicrobiales bacterium]